jgi:simple sugar transport system ATP-binding protein
VALGLTDIESGTVKVCGTPIGGGQSRQALEAGAVGIPEDPVVESVVPGLDVAAHMAMEDLPTYRKRLGIDWAKVRSFAGLLNERTGLRMVDSRRMLSDLSGGNIQRVILTRAFGTTGELLVAAYPSRGLDIATTRRTQELLVERRSAGAGVLFISEDLDELLELSDRIAVFHDGELTGVVEPGSTDRYEIGRLMLGGAETDLVAVSEDASEQLAAVGGERHRLSVRHREDRQGLGPVGGRHRRGARHLRRLHAGEGREPVHGVRRHVQLDVQQLELDR